MKILFLGDSITDGYGATSHDKCYVSLVAKNPEYEVLNYGIGGTRIARNKKCSTPLIWDWDFLQRALCMEEEADKVFVFGGTNDYKYGDASLGEYTTRDPYTFTGAVRCLIEYLSEKYGKEKLCFILPLRRFEEESEGKKLIEYVEIIRTLSEEYGVEYLDFYSDCLPKPETEEMSEYFLDGLHPNDNGYAVIAEKICAYLERKNKNI